MKFVGPGVLVCDPDANGVNQTVVYPGDEVPASLGQESITWLAANGYEFDPMPGEPAAEVAAPPPTTPPTATPSTTSISTSTTTPTTTTSSTPPPPPPPTSPTTTPKKP